MELRVLRYFLAIAREGNITNAAASLHVTQPTLSRQLRELEEELGCRLFIRNSHSVSLTEDGMLLRRRAEEIVELAQKTVQELAQSDDALSGDVYIGAGETVGVSFLTRAAQRLREEFPDIRFHISSGDGADVREQLDRGLIDFGLLFGTIDHSKYNAIPLPHRDRWGVLMRKDSPLSALDVISPGDLAGLPLIVSRQTLTNGTLADWFGEDLKELNIAGTYSLVFNGSLMVKDGMGYALCLDNIINVSSSDDLCFRQLCPEVEAEMHIVWKRYQIFSKAAERYLGVLRSRSAIE